MLETGGSTFSRTAITIFVVLQVFAVKLLLQRFHDSGLIEVPSWVPFFDKSNCGHQKAFEYVITSRNVITPDGIFTAAVRVKDGKIAEVKPINGEASWANLTHAAFLLTGLSTILDYGDLLVAPGLIDSHVHMNQPGRTDWEGMETATKAAAVGGITTVVDMPLNNEPTTTTSALVEKKIWASKGEMWVDVGLWGGIVPDNAANSAELHAMLDAGVLGFKSFMIKSGINDFPFVSRADIKAAIPTLKAAGVPYYLHSELALDSGAEAGECSAEKPDPRKYSSWLGSRPPVMEHNAVKLLVEALEEGNATAAQPGFQIHVAHLADAGDTLGTLRAAKAKGLPISAETCMHYLNFAAEDVPDGATEYKAAPPLRSRANMEALWDALEEGVLDSVASDHSPSPPAMKLLDTGDFMKAWGGISGLQYGLPGTWEGLRKRGLSPDLVTKLWSTFPAKLAGLSHRKGALVAGYDADIVVWDPDALADTSTAHLQHRHKLTPYRNAHLHGRVHATFVRGHQVFNEKQSLTGMVCGHLLLRGQL